MRKVLLLLLALCMGFALVGCRGGAVATETTTVTRPGYTIEINSKWEVEVFEKHSVFYYPDGKGKSTTFLHIYEADRSGFPFESLEKQYESILDFWLADETYAGGEVSDKHSNIVKGTIGGNAFVTADKVAKTPNRTDYSRVLCFCPNSKMLVIIELISIDKKEFDRNKKEAERLFKSIKLV